MRETRPSSLAGTSRACCTTSAFSAATNLTFCAFETPHMAMKQRAIAAGRMVTLSYTGRNMVGGLLFTRRRLRELVQIHQIRAQQAVGVVVFLRVKFFQRIAAGMQNGEGLLRDGMNRDPGNMFRREGFRICGAHLLNINLAGRE